MARRIRKYDRGSIISVVDDAGARLALCRIEAMDGKGTVIGRFFMDSTLDDSNESSLESTGFLWRFGDLNILADKWPVIGLQPQVIGVAPPVFHFLGGHETGLLWVSTYDIFAKRIEETKLSGKPVPLLPKDSLRGAGFVEARLKQIIEGKRTPFD